VKVLGPDEACGGDCTERDEDRADDEDRAQPRNEGDAGRVGDLWWP